MSFDISNIGTWTGSLSLLAWVVYIVFKCFIQESMKSKFAKELQTLKDKNQSELEAFKAGYQKVLDENQIRFSWYHSEQAQVIKLTYTNLLELRGKISDFIAAGIGKNNVVNINSLPETKAFMSSFNKAKQYYEQNGIFYSEELCEQIEQYFKEILSFIYDGKTVNDPKISSLAQTLNSIITALKKDFRNILKEGEESSQKEVKDEK